MDNQKKKKCLIFVPNKILPVNNINLQLFHICYKSILFTAGSRHSTRTPGAPGDTNIIGIGGEGITKYDSRSYQKLLNCLVRFCTVFTIL